MSLSPTSSLYPYFIQPKKTVVVGCIVISEKLKYGNVRLRVVAASALGAFRSCPPLNNFIRQVLALFPSYC